MRVVLVALLLLLPACSSVTKSPGAGVRMGDAVEQPYGYEELCRREPDLSECGGQR